MEQKKGAGRIAKWDNARWILITLVVICHFFENYLGNPVANSLFFYVYTFHMPAFFLIAGLFSKKTVETPYATFPNGSGPNSRSELMDRPSATFPRL